VRAVWNGTSYGAGLIRVLLDQGVTVVEVDRPDRRTRRQRGKPDPIDAEAAARAVLAGVDAQKATGFPVAPACKAAGVTHSAYYTRTARRPHRNPLSASSRRPGWVAEICRIHARSKATCGAPRVHAALRRRGWAVNHKRVERLMRLHGVVGCRPRRR
jgi:hypothetical protein